MAVTLLRHLPPAVAEGVCYGVTDLELAPGWEATARALARTFTHRRPVFTSPLTRCRAIAEAIGHFEIEPDLVEMDFGAWEMQPWDDIDRDGLDAWAADFLHARPHGGESVAMLRERVDAVLRAVPDGSLLITHHGVIKAAAALTGHPRGWDVSVGFGSTLDVG